MYEWLWRCHTVLYRDIKVLITYVVKCDISMAATALAALSIWCEV
jgi:hypothetical protein